MTRLVTFENVRKRYRRGRERINLRAAVPGRFGGADRGDAHWALDDISFTLDAGQSLGLIGPNGAGKSTTLKLVAGVIAATSGSVTVTGRTASLIELGAGFHPDMTGRENLYFSAAVLGMGPKTVRSRFDEIVDFAGIGTYLDTPTKRYSSGMLARLGFAVATHLDVEILVLDEVLAVGDAAFQRKCFARIQQLTGRGVALLYVTHAVWTLPMLCQEAILLSGGRVISRGPPVEVVKDYEKIHQSGAFPSAQADTAVIRSMHSSDKVIDPEGSLVISLDIWLEDPLPEAVIVVFLADEQLRVYASVSTWEAGLRFDRAGDRHVECKLERLPLQPGFYNIYAAFAGDHLTPAFDDLRSVTIEVRGEPTDPAGGMIRIPAQWTD